jgi:hypothetical protein
MSLTHPMRPRPPALAPVEPLASLACRLAAADRLGAEEVRDLRRLVYADDSVSRDEAVILLELESAVGPGAAVEWRQFLIEALTDHMVNQVRPAGFIRDEDAGWLIDRLDDTIAPGPNGFAMLLAVMERARSVPDTLAAFGLRVVERVVLSGQGANVTGECHAPGRVTTADVAALRRVLHVASSEGFGQVTRAEAEVLFGIAEATIDAPNDPAFPDLFARAVANHILSPGGRLPPAAAEVLRRETWLDESRPLHVGIGSFFRSAVASVGRRDAAPEPTVTALETGPLSPDRIDAAEAQWLAERIGRDGRLSEAEHRLLTFLQAETGALPTALAALVTKSQATENPIVSPSCSFA